MTVKQEQLLLCFFECLPLSGVDGIRGPQTEGATRKLQEKLGIAQTGVFDQNTLGEVLNAMVTGEIPTVSEKETTDDWWDEIEFFERKEFKCQCGGKYCNGFPVEPQEKLVRTCDEIRRRLGVPVSIVDAGGSGVRCPQHNAAVGGVDNSNHLDGNAADLHSCKSPAEMARVAEEVMGDTGEIGIYDWGIHVGVNCKYSRFSGRR